MIFFLFHKGSGEGQGTRIVTLQTMSHEIFFIFFHKGSGEGQGTIIVTLQTINHYVSRKHHFLVLAPIGIRIMVYWSLYVVVGHFSQPMWDSSFFIKK